MLLICDKVREEEEFYIVPLYNKNGHVVVSEAPSG